MGYKEITNVEKFILWEIKFAQELSPSQILKFKDLIYNSFLFLNPAKEFYKFACDAGLFNEEFYGLIKVAEVSQNNNKIISKLKQNISANIVNAEKFIVWQIHCDKQIADKNSATKKLILKEMAFSATANNKGLFCNPHYQKYSIEIYKD